MPLVLLHKVRHHFPFHLGIVQSSSQTKWQAIGINIFVKTVHSVAMEVNLKFKINYIFLSNAGFKKKILPVYSTSAPEMV